MSFSHDPVGQIPEDSLAQMDFIMTSRKLEMKHVQVLDSDWFKTEITERCMQFFR